MSAEIVSNTGGIITIKITGKLAQAELAASQKAAAEILRQQGRARLLVVADKFQGWEKRGDWGDLSGQAELDPYLEKMAIVGEQKWQDLALVFAGKGIRRVPVEYFSPADMDKARDWLVSD
jgi:hypothetical protein